MRDLTGIDIKVGIDASSDSVGGEGFANFGDVQFVQDASIERYLEAAKLVADHAVVGAGPLDFFADTGKTGLELSALNRIDDLYATQGLPRRLGRRRTAVRSRSLRQGVLRRVVLQAPRGARRSVGHAARRSRRRKASPAASPNTSGAVVNKPNTGYPTRDDGRRAGLKLPAPTSDARPRSPRRAPAATTLYKTLTTWPSWFFARGDLAAGGAGDESPLVFDDTTLKAEPRTTTRIRWRRAAGADAVRQRPDHRAGDGPPDVRQPQPEPASSRWSSGATRAS